jgi:hypothetical protein
MGKKQKRGKAGNAVQYMTRNQAIKKLQLRLSEFRCDIAAVSSSNSSSTSSQSATDACVDCMLRFEGLDHDEPSINSLSALP